MRAASLSILALSLGVVAAPGCSLVYDGSRFQGGTGGSDAATDDASTEEDGGTGSEDADVDAPESCTTDGECPGPQFCASGACTPCDGDGDGFAPVGVPVGSCMMVRRGDCADDDASRYPQAPPICNNGIDESCFDPLVFPLEGVAEFGFVQPFDVVSRPADAQLEGVQIFARSVGRAVVLTRLDETVRTPLAVEVDMAARSHMDMVPLNEWAGVGAFGAASGTGIYTAALRLGDQVVVSEIHARATTVLQTSSFQFRGEGAPVAAGSAMFDLTAVGAEGLEITEQPLLAQPRGGGDIFWAAPTNQTDSIHALGTTTSHFAAIDSRTIGATADAWGSSSPMFGLITERDNPSFYVWNGAISPAGATAPYTTLYGTGGAGGVTAPGVIVTLDAEGRHGGPYALVALPKRGMIELHLLSCTFGAPAACSDVANGSIALPGASAARGIALSAISDTSVMFLVADSDAADGAHFGSVELYDDVADEWTIPATVTSIPIPVPGMGALASLSVDATFTPDTTVASAGAAIVAYAYIRQPSVAALPSHLSVGGVRACVNYPGF